MAKARISTDVETLPFMTSDKMADVIEERKRSAIDKAGKSVMGYAEEEFTRWEDKFKRASDDQQVEIMTQVYGRTRVHEYICGGLLDIIEKGIFEGKKTGYSSLNAWIDTNYTYIGMSKSEAYKYLSIYRAVDRDTFEKIGVSKAAEIASIKDDKVREKVLNVAKRTPEITIAEIKEKKEEFLNVANKPKREERERVEDRADDIKINVLMNGPRQIVLEFKSQKERDLFNDILLADVPRIKRKIAELLIAEKFPSHK